MIRRALLVLSLAIAQTALAFNPPRDSIHGLTARIEGVPEFADPGQPLAFKVVVQNEAKDAFRGELGVWLNDDWEVVGRPVQRIVVKPGTTAEFPCQAKARDRVLEAHYPVHAGLFTGPERLLVLHPIAIFQTRRPKAAPEQAAEWGVAGGAYVAPRAAAVAVDGRLDEWEKATPVPLGLAQRSTGTLDPESFQGWARMQHDGDFLYLALDVQDDEICAADVGSADFIHSDYLRIYLHGADPAERQAGALEAGDVVVAVNPFGHDGAPLAKIPAYGQPANRAVDLAAWRFAASRTEKGYVVELAAPLQQVGDGLAPGSTIGMNLLVGDADKGRRQGEACLGRQVPNYWLNPQSYLRLTLSPASEVCQATGALPVLTRLERRTYRLASLLNAQWGYTKGDRTKILPPTNRSDGGSGATFATGSATRGGTSMAGFSCHPPYRDGLGGGVVWRRYLLELPKTKPLILSFSTAIRDHNPETEPPSDGVDFRVLAGEPGAVPQELFARFSESKEWQAAEVDLSDYAGRRVLLQLVAGPGPKGNTSCDSAFWGEPVIRMGLPPTPTTEKEWAERTAKAVRLARDAIGGARVIGAYPLSGRCGHFGAGVAMGRQGLVDGVIAFASQERAIAFRGFRIAVGGEEVGAADSSVRCIATDVRPAGDSLDILHKLDTPDGRVTARARLTCEQGALRVAFDMPGTARDPRGTPRFTNLALGGADAELFRVYLGFGNVIEKPNAFRARASGFVLSTRHIGADYEGGLSLLQASDIYPSAALCRPATNTFSLEVPHDATLTFVPSARRRLRRRPALPRPQRLPSREEGTPPCSGACASTSGAATTAMAAKDLERAGKYGLGHSIFVKHSWQRWGYDYRLPDIYPPLGGLESFLKMRDACRETGILFAPHDNYIDFYPDAAGYSYDHMVFNADGTPQRAWFNKGRKAQSYRWLPHAFMPWLERNMRLLRDGALPTGLFIDVFSAMPPIDYYDREGRFHTRARTAREWSAAFDRAREILCPGMPMLSEAGHDALVGSLDGVQSDHQAASR